MIQSRHVKLAARFVTHRWRELHPFEVQALVLNACNLKCAYCRCPELKIPLMTTEQWRTIIRQLGALGTLRIKFQGGEPTLREDFRELCLEAQRSGMLTATVTNGIKVAAQPELLDHLNEIVVSLDSVTPAIHDRLRGHGTHALALRAIDLARARGLPAYVVMVVNRENIAELEPMLDFCETRGVRFQAQPVSFGLHHSDEDARSIALTNEEVRTMHERLAEWKRQGRAVLFSAHTYRRTAQWPDYRVLRKVSSGESACMAGKFYVYIESNGDMWPCQQHGATFTPKNILRDGLEAGLRHAQRHHCNDCYATYLNERKALFGLLPAALWEIVRRG